MIQHCTGERMIAITKMILNVEIKKCHLKSKMTKLDLISENYYNEMSSNFRDTIWNVFVSSLNGKDETHLP